MVTAPLIAAPLSVWAADRLKTADVWRPASAGDIIPGAALALSVLDGSRILARVLTKGDCQRCSRHAAPGKR